MVVGWDGGGVCTVVILFMDLVPRFDAAFGCKINLPKTKLHDGFSLE